METLTDRARRAAALGPLGSAAAVLAASLLLAAGAEGYQFVETTNPDGQTVHLAWDRNSIPVPWSFHRTPPDDFSLAEAIAAAQSSFDTWEQVPTSTIAFRFDGETQAEPFVFFDFINTLGFTSDPDIEDTGILGATSWIINVFTGEIAESDIFFSNFFDWSVAPGGTPGRFDFQSVATHEIGHFLGLGHSGVGVMEKLDGRRRLLVGSAIMFPFAFPEGSIDGRTLQPDDIAGVSALYPTAELTRETGRLSGTVTLDGTPLLGAHVLAFNPFTGETIGVFTGEDGRFRAEALRPGPYIVRVNPIRDPTAPEDFGFDESRIDLDFRDEFFLGRAPVRAGTETPDVDVEVNR